MTWWLKSPGHQQPCLDLVLPKYSQEPLKHGRVYHDFTYSTEMAPTEHKWDIELTKDTPYLALTGEIWGACCEHLGEKLTTL